MDPEAGPLARTPDDDEQFADSMACYWMDVDQRVAGVLAFGTWPNRGVGVTYFSVHDAPRGIVLQRTREPFPLVDGDRTELRLGAGGVHVERLGPRRHRWNAVDPETDTELSLAIDDFHDMVTYPAFADDEILRDTAPAHLETAGSGAGRLRLAEREIDITGLFYRDRSWGRRGATPVPAYHWSVGTTGPALAWGEIVTTVAGAGTFRDALVVVDGGVERVQDHHTLVTVDEDTITVRGWNTRIVLVDGRRLEVDVTTPASHLLDHRVWPPVTATDTHATADVTFDGRRTSGFTALNMVVNPRLGSEQPCRYLGGTTEEGLTVLDPL